MGGVGGEVRVREALTLTTPMQCVQCCDGPVCRLLGMTQAFQERKGR